MVLQREADDDVRRTSDHSRRAAEIGEEDLRSEKRNGIDAERDAHLDRYGGEEEHRCYVVKERGEEA